VAAVKRRSLTPIDMVIVIIMAVTSVKVGRYTRMGEMRNAHKILVGNLKLLDSLGDTGVGRS
jgi:hypothetical protein